MKMYKKTYTK